MTRTAAVFDEQTTHPQGVGDYLVEFENEFTGELSWQVVPVVSPLQTRLRYSKFGKILRYIGPLTHSVAEEEQGSGDEFSDSQVSSAVARG